MFPLSIKRILPIYVVLELVFALSLIFSLSTFYTQWSKGMSTAYLAGTRSTLWSFWGLFPQVEKKQIHLNYYGKQFSFETTAKQFSTFAAVLPENMQIEKEQLDQLSSLMLFDGMEITIPPNLYDAGIASWYGSYFQGRLTASTEPYDMYKLTAAHKTLPLGTHVKVINIENKKAVIVRINDHGPYVGERIIDLSWEAARQLGFLRTGLTFVILELVE